MMAISSRSSKDSAHPLRNAPPQATELTPLPPQAPQVGVTLRLGLLPFPILRQLAVQPFLVRGMGGHGKRHARRCQAESQSNVSMCHDEMSFRVGVPANS